SNFQYDFIFVGHTTDVKVGDELLVDGGMVRFEVIEKIGPDVKCRCTDPGLLLPRANLTFWRDGSLVRERNAMLPTISSKVGDLYHYHTTARYWAVPPKIDCRRSISAVGGRLKKKSTVGGRLRKKKGRRRGKEKKKRRGEERIPRPPAVAARGSPVRHRRPRPLFLPREETERLPTRGERSRRHTWVESHHVTG
ncbi:hypothetical protein GW17_00033851, partial [Ensete ventricosum]